MRAALSLALMSTLALAAASCSDSEPPATNTDSGTTGNSDAGEVSSDAGQTGSDASVGGDAGSIFDGGVSDNCDPLLQSGCTDPATKCVIEPDSQNAGAHCVPPGNDVGLGEECMGEDCLAGLACVMTSTVSSCVQICSITTGAGCEALGSDYDCRTRIIGTNWGACSLLPAICDPLTQDPCAANEACSTFTRRNNVREFRCREAGPQTEGQPCGSSANSAQCVRGNVCVLDGPSGTATCRQFCDSNDDCAPPATCAGVVNDPPFQFCSQ
jgi:hypothetical protein